MTDAPPSSARLFPWLRRATSLAWFLLVSAIVLGLGRGGIAIRNHYVLLDLDANSDELTQIRRYRVLTEQTVRQFVKTWAARHGAEAVSTEVYIAPRGPTAATVVTQPESPRERRRRDLQALRDTLPEVAGLLGRVGMTTERSHSVAFEVRIHVVASVMGITRRGIIERQTVFESKDKIYVATTSSPGAGRDRDPRLGSPSPNGRATEHASAQGSPADRGPSANQSASLPPLSDHVSGTLLALRRQREAETLLARYVGFDQIADYTLGSRKPPSGRLLGRDQVLSGPRASAGEILIWLQREREQLTTWLGPQGPTLLRDYRALLEFLQGVIDLARSRGPALPLRIGQYLDRRRRVMSRLRAALDRAGIYSAEF